MQQSKSIKSVAKEAKMRLKNRFWEDYKKDAKEVNDTVRGEGGFGSTGTTINEK